MNWIKFILVFLFAGVIGALLYYLPFVTWRSPLYHMGYMMYGWNIGLYLLIGVLVIGGLVLWVIKPKSNTLQVLESRLAKGDITIEQYLEIKQQINRK